MYVPAFSAIDEHHARSMVADVSSGWLVTNNQDGPPEATLMPLLWHDDRIIAHMAKANPHWRHIADNTSGLLIVTGPEAYISPSWYASKGDHGRVVPTWNYLAVHITGSVHVHHDSDWLLTAVTDLTDNHETERVSRWQVTDVPEDYITSQLKAIVGVEMQIERVEGKAKLSQNRSASDRRGVIEGLRREPDLRSGTAIADAMRAGLDERAGE